MATHLLWEQAHAGSNPVAPTREQVREWVIDCLYSEMTPYTFEQLRGRLGLSSTGHNHVDLVSIMARLWEEGLVEYKSHEGHPIQFWISGTGWLKLTNKGRAVGQRCSRPSGGRENAGSNPAGPTTP